MKYSMKYIPVALVAFTLATGCDKKLDQANPNQQTSATYWQNEGDAIKGTNATYGSLLIDGTYMRFTPAMMDIRGDDIKSNSPWTAFSNIGKFTLGTADGAGYGWAYEAYYQGISRANQVLQYVPGIAMDETLKNRLIGEAKFLRGLYYFHLVNFYGKVSLATEATADNLYVPQSSEEEGWAQVVSDFTDAAAALPVSYTGNDIGRATKGAALAFLGKSYLFQKKYTEAAQALKAVIDLGIYSLVSDYKSNFLDGAANENNKESVFEVQFSRDAGGVDLGWGGAPASGWGKTSARAITFAPRSFGWTDVQPTRSVYDEFLQEKTTDGKIDARMDATMFYNKPGDMPMYKTTFQTRYGANQADLNDLFCAKYQNYSGDKPDEFDWRSGINERIMRYAEVLMMYAECLNEANNRAEAAKYIQMIRTRANLANREAEFAALGKDAFSERLAHEKLLEFCLEGKRFDDIRRWGWLTNQAKLDLLKSRDPEFGSYQAGREYFPIPQNEIDNNPGFVQNATY